MRYLAFALVFLLLAESAEAAIDSENKRRNAVAFRTPRRRVVPLADGSINLGDRAHLARSYRGVADPSDGSSGTTQSAIENLLNLICKRRRR